MDRPGQDRREDLRDATVDRMLGMVGRDRYQASRGPRCRQIAIAGVTVTLDWTTASFEHQLEQLASAVEATMAYQRATAMLAAADAESSPPPLWLVTGSRVLARWLAWSKQEATLRRVLTLSDKADTAPVAGTLDRSARLALGRTAVRIRVANGLAVAERIELPGRKRCLMTLGRKAELFITKTNVPETLVAGLIGRRLSSLVHHAFFAEDDPVIEAARNDGTSLVIELADDHGPLTAVPEAARAAVPADADRACPWRPTGREVAELYGLVDGLRRHEATPAVRHDPR